jgi:hypothetical protein
MGNTKLLGINSQWISFCMIFVIGTLLFISSLQTSDCMLEETNHKTSVHSKKISIEFSGSKSKMVIGECFQVKFIKDAEKNHLKLLSKRKSKLAINNKKNGIEEAALLSSTDKNSIVSFYYEDEKIAQKENHLIHSINDQAYFLHQREPRCTSFASYVIGIDNNKITHSDIEAIVRDLLLLKSGFLVKIHFSKHSKKKNKQSLKNANCEADECNTETYCTQAKKTSLCFIPPRYISAHLIAYNRSNHSGELYENYSLAITEIPTNQVFQMHTVLPINLPHEIEQFTRNKKLETGMSYGESPTIIIDENCSIKMTQLKNANKEEYHMLNGHYNQWLFHSTLKCCTSFPFFLKISCVNHSIEQNKIMQIIIDPYVSLDPNENHRVNTFDILTGELAMKKVLTASHKAIIMLDNSLYTIDAYFGLQVLIKFMLWRVIARPLFILTTIGTGFSIWALCTLLYNGTTNQN